MENQPVIIEAKCENCAAWKPVEQKGAVTIGQTGRGMCFGLPPTPYPKFDKFSNLLGQMDLRSCPAADNSCLLFTPRPDLISQNPASH